MGTLLRDLRFALRMLARSPGLTAVAALSLALGIGANSALMGLVNGLLLRPLPSIADPEELVRLYTTRAGSPYPQGVSYPDFLDYRREGGAFSAIMAYSPTPLSLSEGGRPEALWGCIVTANYFAVLGVGAARGRAFLPEEDRGAHPVAVLSHGFWQRRFRSDPATVGKVVSINGHPFTVVGIAPEGFIGTEVIFAPDLWVPMGMQGTVLSSYGDLLHAREERFLRAIARLAPGVSLEEARARMQAIGRRLAQEHPGADRGVSVGLVPESEARIEVGAGRQVAFAAAVFLGLVGLVLLIACGNVANLLLARSASRSREIGIRLAIGASRGQLLRQLLSESLLLALLGAACGFLLAHWGIRLLGSIRLPTSLPLRMDFGLDLRVLAFTLLLSLLSAFVFGLAPALRASRPDLAKTLKSLDHAGSSGGRRITPGRLLVIAQIGLSLLLLISAGLFLRSLGNAQSLDLGLEPRGILAVSLDLGLRGYQAAAGERFYERLLERVAGLPGVHSAALAGPVPLDYVETSTTVALEGGPGPSGEDEVEVLYSVVSPGYFATAGTSLLSGRPFDRRDGPGRPPVVIINQELAQRFWPGHEPLGRHLRTALAPTPLEVVGVVETGTYRSLGEDPMPYLFLSSGQRYTAAMTLLVRTAQEPAGLLPAVRREVQALDKDLALGDTRPLWELIGGRALLPIRLVAGLAGTFGLLGLLLASAGLYGVMAYSVSRRTREIGIRMAMGARAADVSRLVLRQAMALTTIGAGIGLAAALALGRLLSGLLLDVDPIDPPTFLLVTAGLALVALAASWIPARRAARLDPFTALRTE